jgi:2-iminobutanoate/2-iminopropanoate deaminase
MQSNDAAVKVICSEGVPTSHLPFSPALQIGEWVYVSGQASVDHKGEIIKDSFEGEFRRSIENLRAVLKGAGLDLNNVVQVRSYVDNPADLEEYNRLYREYFHAPLPVRTTLVGCLGGVLKYEVDVTAYAGKR